MGRRCPYVSSSDSWDLIYEVELCHEAVYLAGDVALKAADGFASGAALGGAADELVAGGLVASRAGQGDAEEGGVGVSVAAAVSRRRVFRMSPRSG